MHGVQRSAERPVHGALRRIDRKDQGDGRAVISDSLSARGPDKMSYETKALRALVEQVSSIAYIRSACDGCSQIGG